LTDLIDIQSKNLAISTIASPVSTEKGFSLEITKPKELRVVE